MLVDSCLLVYPGEPLTVVDIHARHVAVEITHLRPALGPV